MLQYFGFELAYEPGVRGALTLCDSNRARGRIAAAAVRGGGSDMGTVINFRPAERAARDSGSMARASEPAVVIILPVIRIERYDEAPNGSVQPEAGSTARRRRRRRTQRS